MYISSHGDGEIKIPSRYSGNAFHQPDIADDGGDTADPVGATDEYRHDDENKVGLPHEKNVISDIIERISSEQVLIAALVAVMLYQRGDDILVVMLTILLFC